MPADPLRVATDVNTEDEYLLDRSAWLVRLRWLAAVGAAVAVGAGLALKLVSSPMELSLVTCGVALYNAGAAYRVRRAGNRGWETAALQRFILEQLLVDILALTLVIHFSGGIENPAAMLFAVPVALGAMLLDRAGLVTVVLAASAALLLVALGQYTQVLAHHSLHANELDDPLYRSPRYVAGYLCAAEMLLVGVAYIVRAVTDRLGRAEALRRERERVALSRERLARVGEISAGVAHAVRNPLHGLMSSLELLRPALRGNPGAQETLGLMSEALKRIEEVTRRLLILTRDGPLSTGDYDVEEVIRNTLRFVSPKARGSRGQIHAQLQGIGTAELDPTRLGEALTNVLDNALDACRAGGEVTIRTGVGPDPVRPVQIQIIDTGVGIPSEQLSRVFDPFFTTKAVGEGSGLGLAITRRVVEEHGGRVSVDSLPGRGTRVCIELPRERPAAAGARPSV